MKYSYTIILLSIHLASFSQKYVSIQGVLLNESNTTPVEFANISIENTSQGTITNEAGEFIFYIPDSLKNNKLIFSAIGYNNLILDVNKLKENDSYLLKPKIYNLKSIIIMPVDYTAKEIVKLILKNIKKNYPRKKHFLTGFYRETSYNITNAVRLIEAAVGIYNFGINSDFNRDRIKIKQFRKSDDKMEYSFFSKMMYKLFGESNMIYETFESYAISNKSTFKNNLSDNDFTIHMVEMLDTTPVVVLKYENYSHKIKINYGYIYVNISDFAILKIKHYSTVKDKFKGVFKKYFAPGEKYLSKTIRIYNKFDEYYLKYVEYYRSSHGTADYNTKNSYKSSSQLLITDVTTKRRYYERVKLKESSPKDTDLSNITYKYRPNFWNNYNVLTKHKLSEKNKKELEKEKQLETQFKENSK